MEENNIGNQQSIHPEEGTQKMQAQENSLQTISREIHSEEEPLCEQGSESQQAYLQGLNPHAENTTKNNLDQEAAHEKARQEEQAQEEPEQEEMQEDPKGALYISARVISAIFSPFWTPFLGFSLLFLFTYLSIMPMQYKLTVLSLVFCFTVLLPVIGIFFYQKINGWGIQELSERKKRFIPYLLTIMSYVGGLLTMYRVHFPRYMSGILLAALICMILCALINVKWKISTHTASSGMMVGGLLSYSFLFQFNPINALYIFILLSGMLGSARIIVRQHTLNEVIGGFFIGLFCGIIGILFI